MKEVTFYYMDSTGVVHIKTSYLHRRVHGDFRRWWKTGLLHSLSLWRVGIEQAELILDYEIQDLPKNITLLNKNQWKELCRKK